jgi:mRNA interferase MazF
VCVLTRDAAILRLSRVTVAPITRTIRGIRSEVRVGLAEGLHTPSVIACDNVMTIPQRLVEPEPIGVLSVALRRRLDRALRYALAIRG